MNLCGCVEYDAVNLCNQLIQSKSFDDFMKVAKDNLGIASILYAFTGHGDLYIEDRKKYLTYLCTFAWINGQYDDYIFPFYWLTENLHYDRAVAYLILSYVESIYLMEHGSAIRCNWLCCNEAEEQGLIDFTLAKSILLNLRESTDKYKILHPSYGDLKWIVQETPLESKDSSFWKVVFSRTLSEIRNKYKEPTHENNPVEPVEPDLPEGVTIEYAYLDTSELRRWVETSET